MASYTEPRLDDKIYSNCATVADLALPLKVIERHEWDKHGTCSGLDVKSYCVEAASLPIVAAIEQMLSSRAGTYVEANTS